MALKASLIEPSTTALVINEFQRGVVGDLSEFPQIALSARPAIDTLAGLLLVARAAGVTVVHGVIAQRADGRGGNQNTSFAAAARKRREAGEAPSTDPAAFAEVIPELEPIASDFVLSRWHGMSPMSDTGLDPLLRNLGVTTVVAAGASLNVGIMALALDAMNRSYDVVVVSDACSAIPDEYGQAMLRNSFPVISRVATAEELASVWSAGR
jgi:nicotinamidase-related amidase